MLHQLIQPTLFFLAFTLPFWVLYRFTRLKRMVAPAFKIRDEVVAFSCYLYILAVVMLTLVPVPITRVGEPSFMHLNLVPIIHTYHAFVSAYNPQFRFLLVNEISNTFGNLILMMPLGVFFVSVWRIYSLAKAALTAFLCSFFIESVQYFSGYYGVSRYVDVDDVILNTSGAVLAFLAARYFYFKRRRGVKSDA